MATNTKSFIDDAESLKALVEMMPEPERSEYKSYGSLRLESAFPGRKLVVYTLKDGEPSDIEVISFGAFMCNWDDGPSAEVLDARGSTRLLTVPKRLRPRDLFLHIPQTFTLKYKGRQTQGSAVDFVSHYAVLIKTRSRDTHRVEGHTYCVTLNQFHESYPSLKIRY